MGLVGREFIDDARQTAYTLGMPDLAIVEMPRGLTNLTPAEVIEVARAAKSEVVAGLTRLDAGHGPAAALPLPTPHTFEYRGRDQFGALGEFQEDFLNRGFG